jgi:hypothetical protein
VKSESVQRVVGIDWSGRVDAAGQRRHIWAGVWTEGKVTLEAGRTREEITEWLIELARRDAAHGGGLRLLLQLSGVVRAR